MTDEQRAVALARIAGDLDALIADREARVRLMVQTGYDECCAIGTSDGYLRLARCLTAFVRDAEAGQEPMDSGVGAIFPGGDEVQIDSLMHARDVAEVDATAQKWLEGSPPWNFRNDFDAKAIVDSEGVVCVEPADREVRVAGLEAQGYTVSTVDLSDGIVAASDAFRALLQWRDQFGYDNAGETLNLNALRDGFDYGPHAGMRAALVLTGAEVAFSEDATWLLALLAIAREHTRAQLFRSAHFLTLVVIARDSPLIGHVYDTVALPYPDRSRQ